MALLDHKILLTAASQADSLCFDPHKSLGQPRPCGLLFYREALPKISGAADYLCQQPDSRVIGSRGAESFLPLWLTIQSHGLTALKRELVEKLTESRKMADYLAGKVTDLLVSETGIVCFQHPANLQPLVDAGVISTTRLKQQNYYRLVFANRACRAESIIMRLAPYL